jgi:ABC-type glycerol-3-phosphate transport system permease component
LASLLAWGYALLSSYPLLWLALQSMRRDGEILADPAGLPQNPNLDGYAKAFETTPLPQYFLNSVLVTLAVVCLAVATTAAAGYALSSLRFPGHKVVFMTFLGVLLLPAPLFLLPVFLISGKLGILNSHIGLIGPYVAGMLPIGVYLMKTYFDAIPASFAEAAEIDRASDWQIFVHVIFPQIRPAAATVAVLAFMSAWNEYIYALVSIRSTELFTLPIGVADLSAKQFLYGYSPVFAAMLLTSIPVYTAFLLAQKSFISSLSLGGGVKA